MNDTNNQIDFIKTAACSNCGQTDFCHECPYNTDGSRTCCYCADLGKDH